MTATATAHENQEENGKVVKFEDMLIKYVSEYASYFKGVDKDGVHVTIARQRRIADNAGGLETVVKGILGKNVKADEGQAEKIIKNLAGEIAKVEGDSRPLDEELIAKYLTQASQATGVAAIGSAEELKKAIVNLASAKPGDPLYTQDSAIAQLIQYIAQHKDKASRRINYLNARFGEKWLSPNYGLMLQTKLGEAFGIQFNGTATGQEALSEINRRSQAEAQLYLAKSQRTYTAQPQAPAQHKKPA